jgi:predicted nucleic acid-binding protein
MVVLDASIVIAWAYREEGERLDALIRYVSAESAHVPAHWVLEVTNALLCGQRGGRIVRGQRREIIDRIRALPIRQDQETFLRGWQETTALAETHGLTAYDAAYLELAIRLDLPLATLDQDLSRAARKAGVPLFE